MLFIIYLVDGYWTAWEDWSQCSQTCGDGTQYRKRTCSFPSPRNQGKTCPGDSQEIRVCTNPVCQGI